MHFKMMLFCLVYIKIKCVLYVWLINNVLNIRGNVEIISKLNEKLWKTHMYICLTDGVLQGFYCVKTAAHTSQSSRPFK